MKVLFKYLFSKTPFWCRVMSVLLKKPKDQGDHKTGALRDWPQLSRVMLTALLSQSGHSAKQDDIYGASNIDLPCPGS
jgi:hypothetical protein